MRSSKQKNKECIRYLKAIKAALPCYNKAMRKMFSDFKASVESYAQDHPDADLVTLEDRFGSVARIAKDFAGGYSDDYIKSYRLRKKIGFTVITILAIILAIVVGMAVVIILNNEWSTVRYIDYEIIDGKVIF